jgi:peptidoglycan/LPS O-acetylase OafA/YrhL
MNANNLNRFSTDALRGFAALLVLFLHLTSLVVPQSVWIERLTPLELIFPWLFRGEVAVGIFIFLSGFLLMRSHMTFFSNWRNFYSRRFFRIYPVYLFMLLTSISITRQWDFHGFLNSLFLLPNFPGTLWPYPFLSTAWSLGVEWTLYLFFPFFVHIAVSIKRVIWMLCLVQLLILLGNFMGTDYHTLVYGSILGRSIEFILGIVIARNYESIIEIVRFRLTLFMLISYSSVHLWLIWYQKSGGATSESHFRLLQPYIESLFCLFLIFCLNFKQVQNRFALVRVLSFIGQISFPLYLCHILVIDLIIKLFSKIQFTIHGGTLMVQSICVVALSILLAWLIHEVIEKPALNFSENKFR